MDWSKLPDFASVALLTTAFASVARNSRSKVSGIWLTGWVMISLHFAAFAFVPAPGIWGGIALFLGIATLAAGGVLFMWASVPYRKQSSSRAMLFVLIGVYTLYIVLLIIDPIASWALTPAAILIALAPLSVALMASRRLHHPLRWAVVTLNLGLGLFLIENQHRANGASLALNALLFTVYLGCGIHFWYAYRRATSGALITIVGFFTWASVFVAGPCIQAFLPQIHFEDEVWNLPKYIVAVGMILLLLEEQLEHNRYLALHDELTGLPNRRLFQDRLVNAIERARRTGVQVALLLVDLDHFKQVNDSIGHHAGDELLRHVSRLFTGRVRRSDTVARTGGDEFSLILEEPMSRADAMRVSQSLIQLLNEPFIYQGNSVQVGASVGISVFPDDASDAESLCISADLRMYANKNVPESDESNPVKKLVVSEVSPLSQQNKIQPGLQAVE